MKLLLTSSGISNDSIAKALSELANRPLTKLSIIHIPTAANIWGDDKGWIIDDLVALQKQHFKSIDILDVAAVSADIWKSRLLAADVISVGGGNEVYLAKVFKDIGMKEFLLSVPDTKVYMGTSAGSMVAGQYLSHDLLKLVYPEEDIGTDINKPMEFYNFSFIPHLNSSFFTRVRKDLLESLKSTFENSVYSTDDQTAIKISDGNIDIVGAGDYWIYKK